jgi:hypothetical protein
VDPRPTLATADEHPHPPGPEPLWNESWYFDFHDPDGTVGGYVRLGWYPNLGVAWYWGCVVGEGRDLVTVVDNTVPLPARPTSLELRTDGLWADHACNVPLDHWNLGLEAFGVALDDPAETYRGLRGDRTPLGFDLEWDTDGEPYRYRSLDRYEIPCRVQGTVKVGAETVEVDGFGQRDHSWGVRDWWAVGWCWSAWRRADGTRVHGVTTIPDLGFHVGYVQHDAALEEVEHIGLEASFAGDAMPRGVVLTIAGVRYEVEPVGWAPVLLEATDGRTARFPRALARFHGDDGDVGVGWIELNAGPDQA